MVSHTSEGEDWTTPPGRTFHDWVEDPDDPPGEDDLATHMTTLFPPVRPRGWFEVRYLDAQPWRWWPVPVAVLHALLDDPAATEAAERACDGLDDWEGAARDGLASPGLREASLAVLDAVLPALDRLGEDPALIDRVREAVLALSAAQERQLTLPGATAHLGESVDELVQLLLGEIDLLSRAIHVEEAGAHGDRDLIEITNLRENLFGHLAQANESALFGEGAGAVGGTAAAAVGEAIAVTTVEVTGGGGALASLAGGTGSGTGASAMGAAFGAAREGARGAL